ncbi:MAG: hypothetical protein KGJ23_08130 [Euryarchaeota archaeon]|nr:hypothetical protein [Euryarchaeota archaeon]MDE1836569.1 hypothetical protein [Euryarchaeota archaeon]MDE1879236.1 hypothetical protein [Euryarchaeota archaeon]MDE2044539.1 hypothetical protein [Thermoplasmata archaeon]
MNQSIRERYRDEIDQFFQGKTHFGTNRERGFIWVAQHRGVDTLTIEPPEGGQYEVAVRFLDLDRDGRPVWAGYQSDRLLGRNTHGH